MKKLLVTPMLGRLVWAVRQQGQTIRHGVCQTFEFLRDLQYEEGIYSSDVWIESGFRTFDVHFACEHCGWNAVKGVSRGGVIEPAIAAEIEEATKGL